MPPTSEAQTPPHSPLPWRLEQPCMSDPDNEGSFDLFSPTAEDRSTHHVGSLYLNSAEPAAGNAEILVRAANNHEALLYALKIACGDLLAQGMPLDSSTGKIIMAALDNADRDELGRPRSSHGSP